MSILFLSIGTLAQTNGGVRCPGISVDSPAGTTPLGGKATFTAVISDEAQNYTLKYDWTVAGGKIVSGQGTISITAIRTDDNFVAKLEILGLPQDCPNVVSQQVSFIDTISSLMLADFSPTDKELDLATVDRIGSESRDQPNAQVFVLATFVNGTSKTKIRDTVDLLLDLLTGTQQIERARITILTGFSSKDRVKIYLVPPGADNPSCEKCEEFKEVVSSSCPSITLDGPAGIILPGNIAEFTSMLTGDFPSNITYSWMVSDGEIVSGQNGASLEVRIPKVFDGNFTATLEVRGLPKNCPATASATVAFLNESRPLFLDEYGPISLEEEFARLKAAAGQLKHDPTSTLYIVKYPPKSLTIFRKRNRLLYRYVSQDLHIGPQFRMVTGPQIEKEMTKIYIVPPGTDKPQP